MRRDAAVNFTRHGERSEAIHASQAAIGLLRRFAPRNDGLALLLAALLFSAPALAGPRTIDDCEAIKDPSAYNLCLASFGPTRAQKVKSYPGMAGGGTAPASSAVHRAPRPRRAIGGARISYGRGGRVHMEFAPRAR